jgi:hypothetical protein
MPPPGQVEPSNDQPEESIHGLEFRPRARAERDVELVAQEQVLKHEVVALMEEGGQGGAVEIGPLIVPDGVLPSYRPGLWIKARPNRPVRWARVEVWCQPAFRPDKLWGWNGLTRLRR